MDAMRNAAKLGFGAVYCGEENGGTGLSRVEASLIFEGFILGLYKYNGLHQYSQVST